MFIIWHDTKTYDWGDLGQAQEKWDTGRGEVGQGGETHGTLH